MMRELVIPPLVIIMVKGIANLMTHSKCMNVVIEPIAGYLDHIATSRSYGVLRQRVGKVIVLEITVKGKPLSQSRLLWERLQCKFWH